MENQLFVKNAIAKYAVPRCGRLYVADITTSPGRRDVILRQVSYT